MYGYINITGHLKMELHKRTYNIVKTITNQQIVKIKNPTDVIYNGILNTPIKYFLEELNISKAKLVFLHGESKYQLNLGSKNYETNFIKTDLIQSDYSIHKRHHLFRIEGKDYLLNRQLILGYLYIHRNKRLLMSESNAIKYICTVYGDHFLKRKTLTYELNYSKNINLLKAYKFDGKRPGTIVLRFLHYLCRALNAQFGYYCIIKNDNLYVDYAVQRKGEKALFNKKNFTLSLIKTPILSTLHHEFQYIPKSKFLFEFLSKRTKNISESYSYITFNVKSDEESVGFYIFAFANHTYINIEKSKSIFKLVNTRISNYYNYLYQRKTNDMVVNPNFKSRNTKEEDKAFILMPFTLEWSDRIWKKILKPTIESIPLPVKRADDLYGRDIVEDIWSEILTAKIIIADITARNPNVFYELGIAHTLGKDVILLTQSVDDIPFDLNRYRHIIYQDNFDGYETLKAQLIATINTMI